jgi:hypothetical protein
MSGSGGSSRYDWPTTPSQTCILNFQTLLNSADPEVLKQLKQGDILSVEIVVDDGRKLIGAVHPEYGLAGVITALQGAQLLNCLNQAFTYDAIVKDLNSPACRVEVRNRQL